MDLIQRERSLSLHRRKAKIMQIPSQTKPALWGAASGAVALAVVAILTPICVDKFQQNGDATANLTALKKISSSWEQGNFVEKGGWATRPGATSPDYILARACAEKLVQPKSAAQ